MQTKHEPIDQLFGVCNKNNTKLTNCLPVWPSRPGIRFASSLDCSTSRLMSSGVAMSFSKTLTKVLVTGRNLSLSSSVMRLTSESGKAPKIKIDVKFWNSKFVYERSVYFEVSFWCHHFDQKTNEFFRISPSKKRLNQYTI